MDWYFGLPTEWQAMLVLVAGAPYLGIMSGFLVPYRQVKDWKKLYSDSEGARVRALDAMERSTLAIEKMVELAQEDRSGEGLA